MKVFLLELKVLKCDSDSLLICASHKDFNGSSLTQVFVRSARLRIVSLLNNSIFVIKTTIKIATLHSTDEKSCHVFSVVKKIIQYIITTGCCVQQKLFVKKKKCWCYSDKTRLRKWYQYYYTYGPLYLTRTISRMPNFLCMCMKTYEFDRTRLLERPEQK